MESERSGSSSSSSESGSDSGSESGGGSTSGSGSSSGNSSEGEEECLEPITVAGRSLLLPQKLCESRAIFDEVVSARTWNYLEEADRERLRAFLPTFTENDAEEKEKTLEALFNRENFHFSTPLDTFHSDLKQGNFRPDIAKMKGYLIKARNKQQKNKMCTYYANLLPEVLLARERLLSAVRSSPPGPMPKLPALPSSKLRKQYRPAHARAKLRYFEEVAAIRSEVGEELMSEDENYPEGPPQQSRRQRRHMNAMQNAASVGVASTLGGVESSRPSSLECLKQILSAHKVRRQRRENHPELNTSGITLEDIKHRVALVNGAKKSAFGSVRSDNSQNKLKRPLPRRESATKVKQEHKIATKIKKETPDRTEDKASVVIKKEYVESDSECSFIDPVQSPKSRKRLKLSPIKTGIKQEVVDDKHPQKMGFTAAMNKDIKVEPKIKQEVFNPLPPLAQPAISMPVPIKLEDLDGIDMMDLPVELADCEAPSPRAHDPALMETTHANFLSLVRALFPASTGHRASRDELHKRATALMSSPIAPLNTWYNLASDWCKELDSALEFLAGEKGPHPDDFVPYLTYIPETQMYQWIGAGRDCDALLGRLCERWLRARSAPAPTANPSRHRHPPRRPPRCSTSWTVRAPTSAELADFHQQERKRYASANKPFTYVMHGYRAVVGPAGRGPANRASQASLLAADRPRHVSFVSLLKDAVARLPNGEGTKAQIVTLLKMSQYLAPCSEMVLSNAVSATLERLDTVKRDPFLRYDSTTEMWIYLFRHKSEEDWEKSVRHRGKNAAKVPTQSAATHTPLAPPEPPTLPDLSSSICKLESADSGEDSDVDVDDSGPAPDPPPPPPLPPPRHVPRPGPEKREDSDVDVDDSGPVTTQATVRQMPHTPRPEIAIQKTLRQIGSPLASRLQQPLHAEPKEQRVTQQKLTPQAELKPPVPPTKPQPPKPPEPKKPAPKPKSKIHITSVQNIKVTAMPPTITSHVTVSKPTAVTTTTTVQARSAPIVLPVNKKTVPAKQRLLTWNPSTVQLVTTPQLVAVSNPAPPPPPPAYSAATVSAAVAVTTAVSSTPAIVTTPTIVHLPTAQSKMTQGTRSLLLKTTPVPVSLSSSATISSGVLTPALVTNAQMSVAGRRGVVRVLSPATPASGKSLISPRALMQQGTVVATKRKTSLTPTSLPTSTQAKAVIATTAGAATSTVVGVVSSAGATYQHTARPRSSPSHTIQLSSLGINARIPITQTATSGQTVRPTTAVKQAVVQNVSKGTIQLAGQSVQIAGLSNALQLGHSVKLPSGQTVQLAGQTVQLPSGQSVQLSGQSVHLSGQSVQLAGQSVQLAGQSVQLGGQSVQLGGQNVQLQSGQNIQLPSGQSVQLSGQTVQLSGQTVQLSTGQTVQLTSGQTIQLANGQTVQLSGSVAQQNVRPVTEKQTQPVVAKLLTNSQGQVISMEGVMGAGRTLQLANVRPQAGKQLHSVQGVSGVRVVGVGAGARMTRPLLLTHKPLANIILQQGEGGGVRAATSAGEATNHTIVLGNIAQPAGSTSGTPPVLKLHQVSPMQQLKLAQGIKLQQASGVQGVVMSGRLKLVSDSSGHVLARVLRPSQPQ